MKAWIMLMLALTLPMAAVGEEAQEGGDKVSYISLSPPFVGNYGLDGSARLKVYKADISLRVTGADAAKAVKTNDALIRNQLVGCLPSRPVKPWAVLKPRRSCARKP